MVKLFALIILLQGAADGGRAINTDLRFSTRDDCEAAKSEILSDATSATRFLPIVSCVGVSRCYRRGCSDRHYMSWP